ncbi:FUSC family protein [Lysinibacillus yapensis]|uniref:FUSC family protein n=1 Tax=Ureibacillus yapensis TaxID=2304605 RepID=A0A396SEI5_9BACL|nr:FUSC family protein [Lysinibacillus yapensis]RHW38416.1 FUSC family protein [Lysinibacillus yapensis]
MAATTSKSPSILRQALTVNKKPFPWLKAFLAGVAAGLPIAIGLLFGSLEYGLIAGLGGFTYLYVFPIPYAQLAKKLAYCVLGITACVFLGTVLAPHPVITAIMMGIIGATGIFIFGAFNLIGPSAVFFVLIFAMATGMPVAPEEAFARAGTAFLGGAFSWILAMSGWLVNPHRPEKKMVKRTYTELADFLDAIGTVRENDVQHQVMSTLKDTSKTIASGYIPWRKNDVFNRLLLLNNYANKIFLYAVEQLADRKKLVPAEMGESLRIIASIIDSKDLYDEALINLPHPEEMNEKIAKLFIEINGAKDCLSESDQTFNDHIHIEKSSAKRIILSTFDRNSIILINSLRFGFFVMLAALIAYHFELNRSFWVPLSCVAVMSGATIVATFHRAIQRSLGTIFGILIASVILSFHPTGYLIALLVFLLTFITELFIVKNYGLAALFFTPSALIMAEAGSGGEYTFVYFASARLIDVIIGIIIGLIGVWFVGRKSASSRIAHLISKTIRSQAQVFYVLFSNQEIYPYYGKNIEFNKMETNLRNLKTMFETAGGEIPKDKKAIEYYWPIVYAIEELGFFLEECARLNKRPILEDEKLAQYLLIFEAMANAADHSKNVTFRPIPAIEGFQRIDDTIKELQNNLQKRLY